MEVWALEAFGAAYTLQELLTIKSDYMQGRNETLNSIVKGRPIPRPGTPESFKVLMRELQALCLYIAAYKVNLESDKQLEDNEINLMEELSEANDFQSSENGVKAEYHYLNYQTPIESKFFADDKV